MHRILGEIEPKTEDVTWPEAVAARPVKSNWAVFCVDCRGFRLIARAGQSH